MNALLPPDEATRQRSLERYAIMDTPPALEFDRLTALAARLFSMPIALVTLLDQDRQWFKSCHGLDVRETPRQLAFCSYTILSDKVMIIPDATQDARFRDNPLVTGDYHIRFYAGAPLRSPEGHNLGSLCVLDTRPREFGAAAQRTLSDLAACIVDELELHRSRLDYANANAQLEYAISLLEQASAKLERTNCDLQHANKQITQGKVRLQESEARFERMVANVPGMVCQYVRRQDGIYGFTFVSERCRELFECEPGTIEANPDFIREHIHPDDQEAFVEARLVAFSTLVPWAWEGRIRLPSGREKWLQGAARPQEQTNGDVVWDALFLDVTERKRGELELKVARRKAERLRETAEGASRAKSEFLSCISHELRTPLNAILGFAQILQEDAEDGLLSADQASMTNDIHDAGHHLLNLINGLLDISRIEQGHLALVMEPVCVDDVLRDALTLTAPFAASYQISLEDRSADARAWPNDRGPWVMADRQRLGQVLLNLLSNAVKYNRAQGRVCLQILMPSGVSLSNGFPDQDGVPVPRVRICVSDEGAGLSRADVDRLFAPFERLGARHSGVEGTGLGLSLSKNLIEAMGGTIGVESVPGQGSTFWCELPLAAPADLSPLQTHDVMNDHDGLNEEAYDEELPDLAAILATLRVDGHMASVDRFSPLSLPSFAENDKGAAE